jgi:hypothetical protein
MNAHEKFAPLTPAENASRPVTALSDAKASPIMPIPRAAGECDIRFEGRKPDEKFWFKDAAGRVLFGELRWNLPDGDKRIRPCIYTSNGWRAEAPPAPRALFNLDKLAKRPDAPVYLFEGPRKAAKAAPCFPGAVCSAFAGGASATKQIDFGPMRGRDVTSCRDADEAGKYCQEATIAELQSAGAASIRFVDPARLPPDMLAQIPEGKRHKFDIVDLIEAGISPAAIGEAVDRASEPVAISVAKARPMPLASPAAPSTPYPVDALGDVLATAARSIAGKVQCAEAMAAQSVLAVASLAAQALADVLLPYGQTRPLTLFCLTIAASGDRKSSADLEAMAPVRMRERKLREAFEPLAREHAVALAAWRGQQRQIERKRADVETRRLELQSLGPEPEAPIKPILTLGESTAEGLARHMPSLPGALGIFSAEGGQFLSGHGFSPDAKLRTAASFGQLWDGLGLRRLRAGDGLIDLHGRRLACHLMIQPEAAAGVLGDPVLRDQGLLSRFLIASPETLAGGRLWQEPHVATEPALRRYIARLLAIFEEPVLTSNTAGNELAPRVLELSPEAREVWVDFHDAVEKSMRLDGPLSTLRDVAGKAAEQAARTAGVLQIVADASATAIEVDVMVRACELADWYLSEAARLASEALVPPAIRDAQCLLDWLHRRAYENLTAATLQKSGPGQLRRKARLDPALDVLEEHGWLIPTDASRRAWRVERRPA